MILSSADVLDFCQHETLGFIPHRLHLYLEVIGDCFLPEFVNWFIKLLEYLHPQHPMVNPITRAPRITCSSSFQITMSFNTWRLFAQLHFNLS